MKEKKDEKNNKIAIKVENVAKMFRVPHEKHTTLKQSALNVFAKKTYEKFEALKDINFEVKKGEFFGIIGRNGSGKSTLLKLIAGIYESSEGKVDINGKLSPFLELGVGFNMELTGRENIFLGGAILGLSRKEIAEKYDEIVAFSELEEFIDLRMKNYSSGMQVRLAFSLSINVKADILLMDEVLAVGDSNFAAKCLDIFNNHRDSGKTVVLVTHNIAVIQKHCDRALLLSEGKMVKLGKPDEVGDYYMGENVKQRVETLTDNNTDEASEAPNKKESEVVIKKIKTKNSVGKAKTLFSSGDDVIVEINFQLNKKVKELNFAVGVRTQEGVLVFGYTTENDNYKVSTGNQKIELCVNDLNILNGEYYINVICYGKDIQNQYDYVQRAAIFKVYSSGIIDKYAGLINVEHTWEQK